MESLSEDSLLVHAGSVCSNALGTLSVSPTILKRESDRFGHLRPSRGPAIFTFVALKYMTLASTNDFIALSCPKSQNTQTELRKGNEKKKEKGSKEAGKAKGAEKWQGKGKREGKWESKGGGKKEVRGGKEKEMGGTSLLTGCQRLSAAECRVRTRRRSC